MKIAQRLRDEVQAEAGDTVAADVRLGLTYTAVKLDDGRTGVAYSFGNRILGGCSVFVGTRTLAGKKVTELAEFLMSADLLECSLGLAAANAVINSRQSGSLKGDVLKAVHFKPSDKVAMIGFFGPVIPVLEKMVARLEVFEEADKDNCRPSAEAIKKLPESDVALITSTAIINGTVDRLLDAASTCREVVLLGSSTPLRAEVFRHTNVTWLSGIAVTDPDGILRVVSEGAGTAFFKPHVTKLNLSCREASHGTIA